MIPSERVCYRVPLPRGPFFELLAIDDHVSAQIVPWSAGPEASFRDDQVLAGPTKPTCVPA